MTHALRISRGRIAALAGLIAVAATGASAQSGPAPISAGDLAGISRITIPVAPRPGWRTETSGREVSLRLPGVRLAFDTTQIAPGRRASRVWKAETTQEGPDTILTLFMNCDCEAKAFALNGVGLAIDISQRRRDFTAETARTAEPKAPAQEGSGPSRAEQTAAALAALAAEAAKVAEAEARADADAADLDGAPESRAPGRSTAGLATPVGSGPAFAAGFGRSDMGTLPTPSAAAGPPDPATAPRPRRRPDPAEATPAETADRAEGVMVKTAETVAPSDTQTPAPRTTADAAPKPAMEQAPAPASDPVSDPAPVAAATPVIDPQVAAARETLLKQLTRAAEQGLVTFSEQSDEIAPGQGPSAPDPGLGVVVKGLAEADRHLRVRSAIDEAEDLIKSRPPPLNCPPDSVFDLAAWRGGGAPAERIAALRADLAAVLDEPDPGAARNLARLYISLGMGEEAEAALKVTPSALADEAGALLFDLARVISGRPAPQDGPLARADRCMGLAGLWRLAAGFAPDPEMDLDALAEVLALAPEDLRLPYGPLMTRALLTAGQLEAADAFHRIQRRAGAPFSLEHQLAGALIDSAKGDHARAERALTRLALSEAELAHEALALLGESLVDRDAYAPRGLTQDLAAAAVIRRGGELGLRLRVAELKLSALEQGIWPILKLIETDAANARVDGDRMVAEAMRQTARDVILKAANSEEASGAAFARAALAHLDLAGEGADTDPVRVAAARAILDTGLPEPAMRVLGPALSRGGAPARLVAAEAQIALDAPQEALALLRGMEGAEAAALRSAARVRLGDPGLALASLPPDSPARPEAAWRARAWETAAELPEDDPRRTFAAWMARDRAAAPATGAATDPAALLPENAGTAAPTPAEAFLGPADPVGGYAMAPDGEGAAFGRPPPTLRGARAALAASQGARAFVEEVLTDG